MSETPLFEQLKHRKIVQRGLAYLAGAFLVFQVQEVLADPWGLSPSMQRSIHILLLVGFFVQLVIAWYHGEKGRQRVGGVELLILAGLLLAGGLALSVVGKGDDPDGDWGPSLPGADRPSIAVLPLENLSPDPENAYFADGVHEEILTQLSKIVGIRVISRTSVMGYRDTTKNIREISQELGVRNILEGSVRRFENRVRISVKLIEADTDRQLWGSTFERDRGDLFSIQAEVAQRIAASLKTELSPAELSRLTTRPTENPEAHDLWLRGNQYNRQGESQSRGPRGTSWGLALGMYREATELDPSFAAAWARLSYQHSRLHWYGYDARDSRLDSAKAALDQAVLLDPEDPEVLTARGYYSYRADRDYAAAIRDYQRAQEDLPGDAQLMNIIALVRRRQGHLIDAAKLLAMGFESDPLNGHLAEETGNTFRAARAWDEALAFLNRAIALSPDYPDGHLRKADLLLSWQGDTRAARATLDAGSRLAGENDFIIPLFFLDLFEGKFRQAIQRTDALDGVVIDEQYNLVPKDFLAGIALLYSGSEPEARDRLERALRAMESLQAQQPEDARVFRALGVIHGALGNSEEARAFASLAVEMLPMARDAWAAGDMIENRAWTSALLGEVDAAVEDLRFLLETPTRSWITIPLLNIDPRWDGIRSDPRFLELLESYSTEG